jgi:hypothetical protein
MGGIAETSVAARGVRRVMVPCGRNTGVAPQIFGTPARGHACKQGLQIS